MRARASHHDTGHGVSYRRSSSLHRAELLIQPRQDFADDLIALLLDNEVAALECDFAFLLAGCAELLEERPVCGGQRRWSEQFPGLCDLVVRLHEDARASRRGDDVARIGNACRQFGQASVTGRQALGFFERRERRREIVGISQRRPA
jgi:hypothetical protein